MTGLGGLGFFRLRVLGLGFGVLRGFRALGFRVQGLGFRASKT